jgi:carboxyl-terminal processing protease
MRQRPIRFALAAACAVLASLSPPALAEPDSVYAETFDTAWRIIRDTHYDPEMNGVDWDAVRQELRPKALEAESNAQVRAILADMLSRLGESHFSVIPSDAADALPGEGVSVDAEGNAISDDEPNIHDERYGGGEHWLGLDVRVLGDQLVVTSVEPGGPADLSGVTPGWLITKVGPRDVRQTVERLREAEAGEVGIIAWQIFSELLSGPEDSSGRLTLINAADETVTLHLNRVPRPGDMAKFGNLPPMNTRLDYRWLEPGEMGTPEDKRIGYIRFNIFMVPVAPAFERAIHELREADGVIIDVRGNLGGIGALAVGMSRHLLDEKANLGTMQMRGATLNFNAVPARATSWGELVEPFDGKVAVITDGVSASTSEIFAGGLQAIGRAKVFGQRTAGMALPAMMDRLPNGDVLLHAIADYHDSSGRRLEKDGVPPDFPSELSRSDLLQGIDAPVGEAARWIAADSD